MSRKKYAELHDETNIFAELVPGSRPGRPTEKVLEEKNKCDGIEKVYQFLVLFSI